MTGAAAGPGRRAEDLERAGGPDRRGEAGVASERGNASVVMAGLMGVVVMLSCAAMVVTGYAIAAHRARAAADLAAVSGAVAYGRGEDVCRQARRTAADNGARVVHCDQLGDQIDYVVTVRVAIAVQSRVPGLPRLVESEAHAGPVG